LHSRQFRYSLSAAVATVAEVEAEAFMVVAAEAEAFMVVAAEAEGPMVVEQAFMVAEASMAEVEACTLEAASTEAVDFLAAAPAKFTVAAATAERGRSAEEHLPGVTGLPRAATPAHCKIIRRTFVPRSTMANGIRSVTLVALV
jgi:hypothetical protein